MDNEEKIKYLNQGLDRECGMLRAISTDATMSKPRPGFEADWNEHQKVIAFLFSWLDELSGGLWISESMRREINHHADPKTDT